MLRETLCERGLPEEIFEMEVTDSAQAEALGFLGSPTIRIDGNDIETLPKQSQFGLSCRTYLVGGKLAGVPPLDLIRSAICSAASLRHTGSEER